MPTGQAIIAPKPDLKLLQGQAGSKEKSQILIFHRSDTHFSHGTKYRTHLRNHLLTTVTDKQWIKLDKIWRIRKGVYRSTGTPDLENA